MKITRKKKQIKVDIDRKFLDEQKYADQNFHLADPKKDVPDFPEEKGIATGEQEEELNDEDKKRI